MHADALMEAIAVTKGFDKFLHINGHQKFINNLISFFRQLTNNCFVKLKLLLPINQIVII